MHFDGDLPGGTRAGGRDGNVGGVDGERHRANKKGTKRPVSVVIAGRCGEVIGLVRGVLTGVVTAKSPFSS